jgi:hypothetical protein
MIEHMLYMCISWPFYSSLNIRVMKGYGSTYTICSFDPCTGRGNTA